VLSVKIRHYECIFSKLRGKSIPPSLRLWAMHLLDMLLDTLLFNTSGFLYV
jgi:hypothetical protein